MQLKDIMSRDVEVISPERTLAEAACKMRDLDTGFLPVGENDRLIGTLTDRDIAIRAVAEGKDPKACKVRETMTHDLEYCFEDQEVHEAAEMMARKQVRRLPILNREKRLVGVVSLGDIATEADEPQVIAHAAEGVSEQRQHH